MNRLRSSGTGGLFLANSESSLPMELVQEMRISTDRF
jgi:hypothetical protein